MQTKSRRFFTVVVLGILSFTRVSTHGADGPYHFLKEIPVGGEGGWDYSSVDEAGRRLYVSHGTRIVVIDLDKEAVVGEIADTQGVHGLAPAPELGREQRAGKQSQYRRFENVANPLQGRYRREPGWDALRAGATRGLSV